MRQCKYCGKFTDDVIHHCIPCRSEDRIIGIREIKKYGEVKLSPLLTLMRKYL